MMKVDLYMSNVLLRIIQNIGMLVVVLMINLIGSCDQQENRILEQGQLTGTVNIGPICPVESDPPDPNCQPTAETYNSYPIAVWTTDKKSKLGQIKPNVDGSYTIELLVGRYLIDLENQHIFGATLPATVNIEPNETKILDIAIDTGIR